MSKHPSPERVHKIRTRTRRVEAVVHILAIGHKKEATLLLKAVSPIRKKAGRARDMDVFIALTAAIPIECEQECLVELIEHLGSERAKAVVKLRHLLAKRAAKAKLRLKQTAQLMQASSSDTQGDDDREWQADATAAALEIWNELASWPKLNATNIHPFRIKAKELRYLLQLSTGSDGRFLQTLGEVKDTIGEWHDWNELAAIAAGVLPHGSRCPVVQHIRSTAKQKFAHALTVANAMRNTYQNKNVDWTRTLKLRASNTPAR